MRIKGIKVPNNRDFDHAFASGTVFTEPPKKLKLADFLFYCLEKLYGRYCQRKVWSTFRDNAIINEDFRLGVHSKIINRNKKEAVRFGNHVVCRGIIRIENKGKLWIGDNVYIGDDVIISVANEIRIGNGTLIAHGAQIFDNTTHPIGSLQREQDFNNKLGIGKKAKIIIPSEKIDIGSNCWICMNAIVLKGVRIGDRSIVSAGTIVRTSIENDSIFDGNDYKKIISE